MALGYMDHRSFSEYHTNSIWLINIDLKWQIVKKKIHSIKSICKYYNSYMLILKVHISYYSSSAL